MNYAFSPCYRRRSAPALGAGLVALLGLTPVCITAQPADPPTPRQRLEQEMQKNHDAMRARMLAPRPAETQSRALSPDGKVAVSCSSDGKVTLWDAKTGQDLRVIEAYDTTPRLDSNNSALFSPNGKLLFTLGKVKQNVGPGETGQIATYDRAGATIETTQGKLWDLTTGKLLWTLPEIKDGVKWSTAVNTITWSPDNKLLATKARYGPIHLWDAGTGKLLKTLTVPFIEMNALAFSPDGKTLAGSGHRYPSYTSEIMLWDVASGDLERSLKQPDNEHGTEMTSIVFSPNGKLIATGGGVGKYEHINEISGRFNTQFGVAQLWDVKSGVLMTTLGRPVHRGQVISLAFSADGTRLATGSLDQTVGLWDIQTSVLQGSATRYGTTAEVVTTETQPGEAGTQRIQEIQEDGGQTSTQTHTTRLADPNAPGTLTIKRTKRNPAGVGVQDLKFSGDGKILNILSTDKTVRAWDVASASPQSDPLRRIIPASNSAYASFAFTPNSRELVSGEYSKQVRFWTADTQQETEMYLAHSDAVTKVALAPFAPDESRYSGKAPLLATASNVMQWKKTGENTGAGYNTGFEVKLWDSQTHELQHKMAVPNLTLSSLAVSPGGQWVAAACGIIGPLPVGAIANNGGVGVAVGGPEDAQNPADVKQDITGMVMLWDASTGELKQKFSFTGDIPTDLAFSPDGSILVSDGNEAGVTLWKTATGETIRTLDEDRPPPLKPGERRVSVRFGTPQSKPTLAFTADGTRLARSRKGEVKFWNVETGAVVGTITDPENTAKSDTTLIALTPDGKTLATASMQQRLTLWDVATGKALWKFDEKSHVKSRVSMMEMAPNGKTLATSSGGEIRLWDISQAAKGIVN